MRHTETPLRDRYEIHSVLGKGGMGRVYLALDRSLGGKKVAVKEMRVAHLSPPEREEAFACFRQEAHLLASLDHPRLVPVTDFFEEGSTAYLVMGYVEGETLEAVMRARPVRQREVLDWIDQICDVLNYLHRHEPPVLFHDLKPSNVMLDDRDRIRLIDFGIARTLDGHGSSRAFPRGAGTAEFSPLEQFGDRGTDARSDIYALGATMFALLTRKAPPSSVEVLSGDAAPPAPRQANPDISPEVEDVILTAMALDKNDRYKSVVDMRSALSVARHSAVSRARPSEEIPVVPAWRLETAVHAERGGALASMHAEPAGSLATFSRLDSSDRVAPPGVASPAIDPSPSDARAPRSKRRRRIRRHRIIGAALLAAVLCWLAVGRMLAHARAPSSSPLVFTSDPPGAAVWLDGQRQSGVTPLLVPEVANGTHTVRMASGSAQSVEVSFTMAAGTTTAIEVPDARARVTVAAPQLHLSLKRR